MEVSNSQKIFSIALILFLISLFCYGKFLAKKEQAILEQSNSYTVMIVVNHDNRLKGLDYIDLKLFIDNKIYSVQESVVDLSRFPIGSFHKIKYAKNNDEIIIGLKDSKLLESALDISSAFEELKIDPNLLNNLN